MAHEPRENSLKKGTIYLAIKWALFPLAIIIGLSLRLAPDIWIGIGGSNYCVWFDEVWTLMVSRLPLLDALYFIHHFDANPPLSYLFLRLAPQQPDGEILRIVPGIFGVLALAAFYYYARRHFKSSDFWLAAALFAISPVHVWYSLNLRYYSMMDFVSVVWFFLTVRLIAAGRATDSTESSAHSPLVHTWLFVSILGVLTHNLFAAAWLAGILAMFFTLRTNVFSLFKKPWQYLWIAAPLAYWVQVFLWQREFAFGYETTLAMPTVSMFFAALNDYLILYGMMPGTPLQIAAGSAVVLAPVFYLALSAFRRVKEEKLQPAIVPAALWIALFPPTILFAASHILGNPQLFSRRYMIPSAVALLVIWIYSILQIRLRVLRASLILAVILFNLMGLYAVFKIQHPPDWKSAADFILEPGGTRWVFTREPVKNLIVSEASCLQTYLPEVFPTGLSHFALSESGPTVQPQRLREEATKMDGAVQKAFNRYYPAHLSFEEAKEMINGGAAHPSRVYVAYFVTGVIQPATVDDMGNLLSGKYNYEGSREFSGVRVDLWLKK